MACTVSVCCSSLAWTHAPRSLRASRLPVFPPLPSAPVHLHPPPTHTLTSSAVRGHAGSDFTRSHRVSSIDYTTVHAWTDQWLSCDDACRNSWFRQWITGHLQESQALGKPMVLEEFGRARPVPLRNDFYRRAPQPPAAARDPPQSSPPTTSRSRTRAAILMGSRPIRAATANRRLPPPILPRLRTAFDVMERAAATPSGGASGGTMFWLLAPNMVPDYDRYSVYVDNPAQREDASTVALIQKARGCSVGLESPPALPAAFWKGGKRMWGYMAIPCGCYVFCGSAALCCPREGMKLLLALELSACVPCCVLRAFPPLSVPASWE